MRTGFSLLLIVFTVTWGCAETSSTDSSGSPRETSAVVADGSGVDVSGIDLFWQVVDTLSQDEEPSSELWHALFATPGYRALTQSEFEQSFFRESFRIAYMPSFESSLSSSLEEGNNARLLEHYVQVGEHRADLEAFVEDLKRSDPMRSPSRLAAEWLPDPAPDKPAPLAVVVFDMDARGYDPIVIDLLAAMELDLNSFLAHESHHWYRNDRATIDWNDVPPHEAELLWTLYQIQGEGIADQIDKRPWIEGDELPPTARGSYVTDYASALAATPITIQSLDSLLVAFDVATSTDDRAAIGARVAELVPMSGHPTGYFMARAILETLGQERLVMDVANPVAFFRTYDEAARVSGTQAFSSRGLSSLEKLEARFRH